MRRIFRMTTALSISTVLAITPTAVPLYAQEISQQSIIDLLGDGGRRLLTRLDELEASAKRDAARMDALLDRIDEQQSELDAAEASLVALSQALASVEALGQKTADLVEEAAHSAAAPAVSEELQNLLTDALGTIQPGNWTEGMDTTDILAQMEEARRAAEAVRREFEKQRDRFEGFIQTACSDSPLSEDVAGRLAPFISGAVPASWNADLASTAAQNEIPLPDCFAEETENGRTLDDELRQYMADQQASQQMSMAMNSMMMAAMSTGNPYVIAAAFVIMALMAIFSDSGGGGGGDGEGSGSGDGSRQGDGTQGSGTSEGTADSTGPEGGGQQEGEGAGEATSGSGEGGGSGVEGGPQQLVDTAVVPPVETYANVEPGLGIWVEVIGQTITFTDSTSGDQWLVNWPPRIPDSDLEMPEFTNDVRILSASVVEKTFTIETTIVPCETQILQIGADTSVDDPGALQVLTEDICLF